MILHDPLQPLRDLDRDSPQFHKQLIDFFRGNAYQTALPNLQDDSLTWIVEFLDSVLVSIDHTEPAFRESLHELGKICGAKEVLPTSCTLPESLLGCLDEGSPNSSKVRVMLVKIHSESDPQRVQETFRQIAVTSKYLVHTNIVPLLGVTLDPLRLISDQVLGGDLLAYIEKHADADRLSLLSNIADGLHYLHSCNVIHGNLNGSNIFVDPIGHARITDSGLATVTQDLNSIRTGSAEHDQSARWIAPEILDDQATYSKEADVFSFAGVTIEAFTGVAPFHEESPHAAILAIKNGGRPPRPTCPSLTDGLWALIQRCWSREAQLRPRTLRISCAFGVPAWKRLISRSLPSEERVSLITIIFSDRSETELVGRLSGNDAQSFVDVIDQMLNSLGPRLRKKSLNTLCKICGRQALLPKSLHIPLCYDRSGEANYSGGYADVWMGEHHGRKVAVKVLKIYATSNLSKITKRFCREVVTWKSLRHQNVLPLLGVTMSSKHFAMVSVWMVHGNINEFIKKNPDANRFELLEGVASGLIHMHSQEMVHGDLKGANIMIDDSGHARLADFGLLTFVSDPTNTMTSHSAANAGTTRWMSPELLYPELFGFQDSRPTTQSDYYAFGMVILEVLSGEPPFPRDKEFIVMRKVIDGERPERPGRAWFTDDLWGILEQCWSPRPSERPTAGVILECLSRVSKILWPPLLPIDDPETESDESVSAISIYTEDEAREDDLDDMTGPFAYASPPPRLIAHRPLSPEPKWAYSGASEASGTTKRRAPDQVPARTAGAARYRKRRLLSSVTSSALPSKTLSGEESSPSDSNSLQTNPLATYTPSSRSPSINTSTRSLHGTPSTSSISSDEYMFDVMPPSRPGSPASSEDTHTSAITPSARDGLRVKDVHHGYRPLSHRHAPPVPEPPLGFIPFRHSSAQNRPPPPTGREPLSPVAGLGYNLRNLPTAPGMHAAFSSKPRRAHPDASGIRNATNHTIPIRTTARASSVRNRNKRPPPVTSSSDDEGWSPAGSSARASSNGTRGVRPFKAYPDFRRSNPLAIYAPHVRSPKNSEPTSRLRRKPSTSSISGGEYNLEIVPPSRPPSVTHSEDIPGVTTRERGMLAAEDAHDLPLQSLESPKSRTVIFAPEALPVQFPSNHPPTRTRSPMSANLEPLDPAAGLGYNFRNIPIEDVEEPPTAPVIHPALSRKAHSDVSRASGGTRSTTSASKAPTRSTSAGNRNRRPPSATSSDDDFLSNSSDSNLSTPPVQRRRLLTPIYGPVPLPPAASETGKTPQSYYRPRSAEREKRSLGISSRRNYWSGE